MNLLNLFKNTNSASAAKNRLKVILTSERSQVPEKVIDKVTREFAEILEKYFEVDSKQMDIEVKHGDDPTNAVKGNSTMIIVVPILKVKEKNSSWE